MRRDVARDRQPALPWPRAPAPAPRPSRRASGAVAPAARPRRPPRAPRARWPRPRPPRRPASPGARARSRHTPRPPRRRRSASRPRRARRSAGPATRHRPAHSGAATETGRATPSSEKPATPASASSPSAASCSPARPAVVAPHVSTRTGDPEAAAAATTRPTTPGSSAAGAVLGIAHTVVNPPWAAAASPVAIVSASSRPGSRRCACRSMNPGAIRTAAVVDPVQPGHATSTTPSSDDDLGRAAPPAARVDEPLRADGDRCRARPTADDAGVKAAARPRPGQQVQQRHPDRHAVRDLVRDDRPRAERDVGGDLHALVHRARVHDEDVRRGRAPAAPG